MKLLITLFTILAICFANVQNNKKLDDGQPLVEVARKMKAIEGMQPQINDMERRLGIMQSTEPVLENSVKNVKKVVDVRGMGKKRLLEQEEKEQQQNSESQQKRNVFFVTRRPFTQDYILSETAELFVQYGFDFELLLEVLEFEKENLVISIESKVLNPEWSTELLSRESTFVFIAYGEDQETLEYTGIEEHREFLLEANRFGCFTFVIEEDILDYEQTLCLYAYEEEDQDELYIVETLEEYCDYCLDTPNNQCVSGYEQVCTRLQRRRVLQEEIEEEENHKKQVPLYAYSNESQTKPKKQKKTDNLEKLQKRIKIEEKYYNRFQKK